MATETARLESLSGETLLVGPHCGSVRVRVADARGGQLVALRLTATQADQLAFALVRAQSAAEDAPPPVAR